MGESKLSLLRSTYVLSTFVWASNTTAGPTPLSPRPNVAMAGGGLSPLADELARPLYQIGHAKERKTVFFSNPNRKVLHFSDDGGPVSFVYQPDLISTAESHSRPVMDPAAMNATIEDLRF